MLNCNRTVLIAWLLLVPSLVAAAAAVEPPPAHVQALTPEQQQRLSQQNAEIAQAALRVAQMVDANRLGALWDGASAVTRKAIARETFIEQVGRERAQLGAPVGRGAASVTRVEYGPGARVPQGLYVNVSFPGRFANAAQPVRELISFRLDEDRNWRLSGYSLRMPTR